MVDITVPREKEMVDIRRAIESFFIMLKEDTYVLIRIQALVALVTAMFFVMFIVDFHRCRSRSSVLNTVFKTVDSLSDRIVVYLLGSMQAASFENEMFPVWAVVLVSLRASLGYLSGYGILDRDRRISEVANVIKFMGAGVLNGTRGLEFTKPLWSLWAILLLRSIYRFVSHDMAIRSLWHGRSSEFLPAYMRDRPGDHERGNSMDNGEQVNDFQENTREQVTDSEQRYLVCGETNQKINLRRPAYTLHLEVIHRESLITLDKISACTELLVNSDNEARRGYMDMSLAFTLSRLLRCRLEDVTLNQESIDSTRNLITSKITASQAETAALDVSAVALASASATDEAKRAFKILELELGFLRDYFFTLYPVVFWRGLGSLCLSLLLSMATFAVAFWLAVDIRKVYHHAPVGNFMLEMHGGNVDVLITWVFLLFMMFKEVWEMITYLLSNWTRLLLVCKYAQNQLLLRRLVLKECVIRSFFKSKIADTWHGRMDQYDFLESCNYRPLFRKVVSAISLGKISGKLDGRQSGKDIKIPECVKPAILQALHRVGLNHSQLPKEIPSLRASTEHFERYSWACLDLQTCSQVILVWHIATSLCEIKFAQDHYTDLIKPGFLRSAGSRLKKLFCCTSQPYLDENILPDGELKNNYQTATSLSRYCAYLQVFVPALLPDSFVVPDLIFGETLKVARKQLETCNLIQCRYNKLMGIAEDAPKQKLDIAEDAAKETLDIAEDAANERLDQREEMNSSSKNLKEMNIVEQGATLGKALIEKEDEETRWKILAGLWAELLVHIAPSWNAVDHKYCLESGGEFITLIWVLLSHCGIEKSNLWEKDEAPQGNDSVANADTNNIPPVEEEKVSESNLPVEEKPNEDGIESDQELHTSDLTRRARGKARADDANQTPIVLETDKGTSPSSSTN